MAPLPSPPIQTGPTVWVACKLPHGLQLSLPGIDYKPKLVGALQSRIIGATHGRTRVLVDFWDKWLDVHKEYTPVLTGMIFAEREEKRLDDRIKDQPDQSGFEGIDPAKPGEGVERDLRPDEKA